MSILTRPRQHNTSLNATSVPESVPSTPPTAVRRTLVAEAPEQGSFSKEDAPERTQGRAPEAPDAGEGRGSFLENEFTHGRSQS